MAGSSEVFRGTGYLLAKLGQAISSRFAERIAPLGIRPKHYGLLVTLATTPPGSQQELGRALGIVPSAVVTMIDDLENLGAVVRHADPANRRRFVIGLTPEGRTILEEATRVGRILDDEVFGTLGAADAARFATAVSTIAASIGINTTTPNGAET